MRKKIKCYRRRGWLPNPCRGQPDPYIPDGLKAVDMVEVLMGPDDVFGVREAAAWWWGGSKTEPASPGQITYYRIRKHGT